MPSVSGRGAQYARDKRESQRQRYPVDRTLDGGFQSVGPGLVGSLFPNSNRTDDFDKLLQRINRPMPARGSKRGRMAPSRRSVKRKAPRGKKRSIKRKAPIRKSAKRKKRKVSSPSVPLTVGTARKRIYDHTTVTYNHAHYQAFSSIGAKASMLEMVAQGLILHYMHRCGDYRANAAVSPHDGVDAPTDAKPTMNTWGIMTFLFTTQGTQNYTDDETFSLPARNTGTTIAATIDELTALLSVSLLAQAKAGRRLANVTVYRIPSSGSNQCILNDIYAGRNHVEFSSLAQLKLQNVTDADTAVDGCDRQSALNIHRNPLDGLVYKFKNAVPKMKQGYILSKTSDQQLAIRSLSWTYASETSGISPIGTNGGTAAVQTYGDTGLSQFNEWKAPPPTPSTIFTNFAGKDRVAIAPGSHKTFSMKEFYKGPFNSFLDRYFPTSQASNAANSEIIPPGGSCMMVCLKPKYRTSTSEDIKLETEHQYTYQCRISRSKIMPLPMTTSLI